MSIDALKKWWAEQAPITTSPQEKAMLLGFLDEADAVVASREFWASVHPRGPLPPRPLTEIAFMAGVTWARQRGGS